eukprot:6467832-Amphidinium_carterae.2
MTAESSTSQAYAMHMKVNLADRCKTPSVFLTRAMSTEGFHVLGSPVALHDERLSMDLCVCVCTTSACQLGVHACIHMGIRRLQMAPCDS